MYRYPYLSWATNPIAIPLRTKEYLDLFIREGEIMGEVESDMEKKDEWSGARQSKD